MLRKITASIILLSFVLSLAAMPSSADALYEDNFFDVLANARLTTNTIDDIYSMMLTDYASDYYALATLDEISYAELIEYIAFMSGTEYDYDYVQSAYDGLSDYAFSSARSAEEKVNVMLHYIASFLAYTGENTTYPGGFPNFYEAIQAEYYSFDFVMDVLLNAQAMGEAIYGEGFSLYSYYANTVTVNTERVMGLLPFSDSIIGSNDSYFVITIIDDVASFLNTAAVNDERDDVIDFLNKRSKMVASLSNDEFEDRYDDLYDYFGGTFADPEEMLKEVIPTLDAVKAAGDGDALKAALKTAIRDVSTIPLYDFQPLVMIEQEAIELAYLTASEFVKLLVERGYTDASMDMFELNCLFDYGDKSEQYMVSLPGAMYNFCAYYDITSFTMRSKIADVAFSIPSVAAVSPKSTQQLLVLIRETDVIPDKCDVPIGRYALWLTIDADGLPLDAAWGSGDVMVTKEVGTELGEMDYYGVSIEAERSVPDDYKYDKDEGLVTFSIEDKVYYVPLTKSEANISDEGDSDTDADADSDADADTDSDADADSDADSGNENGGGNTGGNDTNTGNHNIDYSSGRTGGDDVTNPGNNNNSGSETGNSSGNNNSGENGVNNGGNDTNAEVSPFTDVSTDHWAYEYIKSLAERGILAGVGDNRFAPEDLLTREQFVHMIITAFSLSGREKAVNTFGDVDSSKWYADSVLIGKKLGIINGTSEFTFGIGQNITRQDLATIAFRSLGVVGVDMTPFYANAKLDFTDADDISSYAAESIGVMQAAEIINGFTDGSFAPKANATRAQAAKIIYMLLELK